MLKNILKKIPVLIGIFILLIGIGFVLYFTIKIRNITGSLNKIENTDKKYYVLICGNKINEESLKLFYDGALLFSRNSDCVIELVKNNIGISNSNIEDSLTYASYVCASGVIVYSGDELYKNISLENIHSNKIPLILSGIYDNESNAEGYLPVDIEKYANEIFSFIDKNENIKKGIVFTRNNQNLKRNKIITDKIEKTGKIKNVKLLSSDFNDDEIREYLLCNYKDDSIDTVICLTESDTVKICELIVDLNLSGKLMVIGIGEGSKCKSLESKGLIVKLIEPESKNLGYKSIQMLNEELKKNEQ